MFQTESRFKFGFTAEKDVTIVMKNEITKSIIQVKCCNDRMIFLSAKLVSIQLND